MLSPFTSKTVFVINIFSSGSGMVYIGNWNVTEMSVNNNNNSNDNNNNIISYDIKVVKGSLLSLSMIVKMLMFLRVVSIKSGLMASTTCK